MPLANSLRAANDLNAPNDDWRAEAEQSENNPRSGLRTLLPDQNVNGILSRLLGEPQLAKPKSQEGSSLMAERDDIREEIKDKLATAEAKTETRLAKLESQVALGIVDLKGQIGLLANDIAAVRRDKWVLLGTIAAVGVGLAALIVGLATYGDAMFGRGMNVHDVVRATIKETLEQVKKP
jgi:hypothetical protein